MCYAIESFGDIFDHIIRLGRRNMKKAFAISFLTLVSMLASPALPAQSARTMATARGCVWVGPKDVICNPPITASARAITNVTSFPVIDAADTVAKTRIPVEVAPSNNRDKNYPCSLVGMHRPCHKYTDGSGQHWHQD